MLKLHSTRWLPLAFPFALAAALGAHAQIPTAPTAEPVLAPAAGAIIAPPSVTAPRTAAGGWTAQQVAQAFLRADANRDGSLSREETQSLNGVRLNFEALDLNKDGLLSRSEFEDGMR